MRNEVFVYNNTPITFQLGGSDVMVNATEMAKPFGKNSTHWLRNQSTQEFLKELSTLRNRNPTDLLQVVNGGNNSGTWLHEDVALEFARWLSPAFAIWCNDRIKELLKHGFTASDNKIDELVSNPDLIIQLAVQLKTERQERQRLEEQNELHRQHLQLYADMTEIEYLEFKSFFQFHLRNYRKERSKLLANITSAYVNKHDLFAGDDSSNANTDDVDWDEVYQIMKLSGTMDSVSYFKSIE